MYVLNFGETQEFFLCCVGGGRGWSGTSRLPVSEFFCRSPAFSEIAAREVHHCLRNPFIDWEFRLQPGRDQVQSTCSGFAKLLRCGRLHAALQDASADLESLRSCRLFGGLESGGR